MDYDSIAKAGSMLGSGAVIVMDETTCMVKALSACPTSTTRSPAASARRAARAPAGCTAWCTASSTGRAARGPRLLNNGRRQHRRPHDLRAGRRGRAAGEELPQALPRRIRPHRPQALPGRVRKSRSASCPGRAARMAARPSTWGAVRHAEHRNRRQATVQVAHGSTVMEAANRSASTCRTSATTRSCPSRPTAACASCRSRRRPSRCRRAPRRSPTA
jgi:hypothetical protein